jgi:O-antigen ligase
MALHYLARSKRKLVGVVGLVVVCAVVIPVLPDAFWERMSTITTAREDLEDADASVRGRLYFWELAWQMAVDRPLVGVGVSGFNAAYPKYNTSDEFGGNRSVHSSWFGVLSELGFPGLFMFVGLVGHCFWLCFRSQRIAKKHPELENLGKYANALEGALLVFCVGGAFVIFHYNEFIWHVFGLSIALDKIVKDRLAVLANATAPAAIARPLVPVAAMAGHFFVPPAARPSSRASGT